MKKLILWSASLLFFGVTKAQKVYSVDYENQADVKVFVVNYENQADLKVYKVKYENQAKGNEGKWFFTPYQNQAKKKLYFVKYENQADLKIYFVAFEKQAGWQKLLRKVYFIKMREVLALAKATNMELRDNASTKNNLIPLKKPYQLQSDNAHHF